MGRKHNRRDRGLPDADARPSRPIVAVARPAPVAEHRQQFLTVIENLMAQALEVSILDEGGSVVGLRLAPRGQSRPIPTDRVGRYTHDLVASGRVRLVPQS